MAIADVLSDLIFYMDVVFSVVMLILLVSLYGGVRDHISFFFLFWYRSLKVHYSVARFRILSWLLLVHFFLIVCCVAHLIGLAILLMLRFDSPFEWCLGSFSLFCVVVIVSFTDPLLVLFHLVLLFSFDCFHSSLNTC